MYTILVKIDISPNSVETKLKLNKPTSPQFKPPMANKITDRTKIFELDRLIPIFYY